MPNFSTFEPDYFSGQGHLLPSISGDELRVTRTALLNAEKLGGRHACASLIINKTGCNGRSVPTSRSVGNWEFTNLIPLNLPRDGRPETSPLPRRIRFDSLRSQIRAPRFP